MSGKGMIIAIVASALVALAVVGGMLLGVFEEGGDDSAGFGTGSGTQVPKASTNPVTESGGGAIPTKIFDPKAGGSSEVAVSESESGLHVWGMVEGEGGAPVAGATVELVRDVGVIIGRAQEDEHAVGTMTTRAGGAFRFRDLERKELYVLRVSHPEYATARVHPIDPRAQQTTQNVIVRVKKGLTVSGKVTDPTGQPIEGAAVSVYDLTVQAVDPEGQVEAVAKTGPDGTYTAANVTSGTKKVIARMEGYAADGRQALNVRNGGDGRGINIVLRGGLAITGVVIDRDSKGPIKGALVVARPVRYLPTKDGNAVNRTSPGHKLRQTLRDRSGQEAIDGAEQQGKASRRAAYGGNISSKMFLTETVRTDEDGNFRIPGLFNATYRVSVRSKGFQPQTSLNLNAGRENVEVALSPSASVEGTVIDHETGKPITKFSVAVTPNGNLNTIPIKTRQTFEDEEGRFKYTDVAPGTKFVLVEAEGYAGGRAGGFPVALGETVTGIVVRVVKGATLTGTVLDNKGAGVGGAAISLGTSFPGNDAAQAFMGLLQRQMRKNNRTVYSGSDGSWSMPNVLAGTYAVKVSHGDYADGDSTSVTCDDSGTVAVPDISLSSGGTIRGTVITKSGEPDPAASVMINSAVPGGLPYNWSGKTNIRGEFECRGLKPGTYRVLVHQREGQVQIFKIFQAQKDPKNNVSIAEGEVVTLTLNDN